MDTAGIVLLIVVSVVLTIIFIIGNAYENERIREENEIVRNRKEAIERERVRKRDEMAGRRRLDSELAGRRRKELFPLLDDEDDDEGPSRFLDDDCDCSEHSYCAYHEDFDEREFMRWWINLGEEDN